MSDYRINPKERSYIYEGEVKSFENIVCPSVVCYTKAVSEKQALSRCAFKAKMKFGFDKTVKLSLNPAKIH